MSPSRRASPPFCMPRARSRSSAVILPSRTRRAPSGCGSLPTAAATTPPRSKQTVAGGLPQLGRHPQDAALPAQVEQLEDVLDVQLLERALERHGQPAEAAKMCCRSRAERARLRACGGVGSARVELHDPLPGLHGLIELPLPRERGALVVERAGVLGVEAEHPGERLERLRRCGRPPAARGPAR